MMMKWTLVCPHDSNISLKKAAHMIMGENTF